MTDIEARITFRVIEASIARGKDADVSDRLIGRLRPRIERFAVRVRHATAEAVILAGLPLELPGVIPALGKIRDDPHIVVPSIRPPLIGARHAQAHFVCRDRHGVRTSRIRGRINAWNRLTGSGALPIGSHHPSRPCRSRRSGSDRDVIPSILQQILSDRADVAGAESRIPERLPLEGQVPLPGLGHLQIRIDKYRANPHGLEAGREYEAVERIGKIRRVDVQ